jgi:signal transduction histidine kinase
MSATITRPVLVRTAALDMLVLVAATVVALVSALAQLTHAGLSAAMRAGAGQGGLGPLAITVAAVTALPLLAGRRHPLTVFITTTAASVLLSVLGHPLDILVGPAIALYLVAGRDRWTWRAATVVLGLFVVYLLATGLVRDAFPSPALLHSGLAWAAAWFAGERTRLRRGQLAELADRAHRAERDAERDRLLAAAEERARIARDLHDSAGHTISVIAVRAGAARLRHRENPDRSLAALTAIEELARHTAAEIDYIVGALRDDGPVAPLGLATLDTLIAHHTAAGLDVALTTTGSARTLPTAVDQAAYRILQEALTNAARHGTGPVTVALTYGDHVEITVTNPVPPRATPRGGGHGMTGMRERATLLGGDLHVDDANGIFRLHVRIPDQGDRE